MRISILSLALLIVTGAAFAQAPTDESSAVMSAQEAVWLARAISTSEFELSATRNGFVSLDKLMEHRNVLMEERNMQSLKEYVKLTDATSGTAKGWRLSVIAAADGKHFHLALIPDQPCQTALFSNESGLIYTGKAGGCAAK